MFEVDMARHFGQVLRAARESKGLSQEQLAYKMGLKKQGSIPDWESKPYPPRGKSVERAAAALGLDPMDLLDDVMTPWGLPMSKAMLVTATASARAPDSGTTPVKRTRARSR